MSSSSTGQPGYTQLSSFSFKNKYSSILDNIVIEFTAITRLTTIGVAQTILLQHCCLVITLDNDDLILTDFDNNGINWSNIQSYSYRKYKDFQPYNNRKYTLRQIIDIASKFNTSYNLRDNNCFYYVNFILNSFTDNNDWILYNWEKEERQEAIRKTNYALSAFRIFGMSIFTIMTGGLGLLLGITTYAAGIVACKYNNLKNYEEYTFHRKVNYNY